MKFLGIINMIQSNSKGTVIRNPYIRVA